MLIKLSGEKILANSYRSMLRLKEIINNSIKFLDYNSQLKNKPASLLERSSSNSKLPISKI